jgi:hypothetical protein
MTQRRIAFLAIYIISVQIAHCVPERLYKVKAKVSVHASGPDSGTTGFAKKSCGKGHIKSLYRHFLFLSQTLFILKDSTGIS